MLHVDWAGHVGCWHEPDQSGRSRDVRCDRKRLAEGQTDAMLRRSFIPKTILQPRIVFPEPWHKLRFRENPETEKRIAVDPIHQFQITKLFTLGHIGGQEIAFTNSSAYMFGSVAVISLLMIGGVAGRQLVPGRIQSVVELSYEFVANTIRGNAGSEGMKFFPLVFSLFMFVTVSNVIGIIPYFSPFQATSSSPRHWQRWYSLPC
jgi:hypothetical protein